MLVVEREGEDGAVRHASFAEFPSLLNPGDVLVLNDTKVFPARLLAKPLRGMERQIEVLLTKRTGVLRWECWCKPARRVRIGDRLEFSQDLCAIVEGKGKDGSVEIRFDAIPAPSEPETRNSELESAFWSELDRIGQAPLPPYIHSEESPGKVREDYQTV